MDLVTMGCGMKRWHGNTVKNWLTGSLAAVLALGSLSGCTPTFLSQECLHDANSSANLMPEKIEKSQCGVTAPVTETTKAPPTVSLPERPPRYMSLQEAIAISLENGLPSGNAQEGTAPTTLATFNGPGSLNNQTDRIRVLALNPAIANAAMEASLARFDANWVTSMSWTNTDEFQQGLSSFNNGQGASFNSSVVKAFADGSVGNVSFITNYTNLNTPPVGAFANTFNPQYTTKMSFGYEIPLWRDAGVEINQLLARFPTVTGNAFTANPAQVGFQSEQGKISSFLNGPTEGILISKLRFDQNRVEFERNVHIMLKNVEIAYWNLYNKYGQLYSFEDNLRILQKAYQESYNRFQAGAAQGGDPYRFYQTKGQYEEFRGNRIQAMEEVLDAERNLRGLLGMPVEDGTRVIPITPPTLAEMKPDWDTCLQDAVNLRPELILARENLRYHQYLLTVQKNGLKPDLRAFMKYEPIGFGSTLAGNDETVDGTGTPRPTNAFRSLAGMHYADYQIGVYMNVPIGYRYEYAAIRAARLQLAQSYYFLRDQEEKATRYVAEQYQQVNHWWKRIEVHRAERLAYTKALNLYVERIKAGQKTFGELDFLQIQRSYAAALVKEYGAIAEYNNSMARLEWAKGSTLRHNNVHISEGAVPQCALVNAAQYEKEKSRSIVLRERPDVLAQPGRMCATKETDVVGPDTLPPVTLTTTPPDDVVVPAAAETEKQSKAPATSTTLDTLWKGSPTNNGSRIDTNFAPAPASLPLLESAPQPIVPPVAPPTSKMQQPGTSGNVSMLDESTSAMPSFARRAEVPVARAAAPDIVTANAPAPLVQLSGFPPAPR